MGIAQFLTVDETARHLGCSHLRVYRLIQAGHLGHVHSGAGIRVDARDVTRLRNTPRAGANG